MSMRNIRWSFVGLVLLCWAPVAIGIGYASVWQWSQTAATNASADGTINWREGQPPSSVNDSARAMMAAVAVWRDYISGAIVTTGTSTAYNVTTLAGFDTLAHLNGASVCFTPHATNGGVTTLSVDALTARPLRSSPSTEIGSGVLVQGTPYCVTYNNSDSAFYLSGFYGSNLNVPLGVLLDYTGDTAPNSNFILPAGQAISRTTYAGYFALVGTRFGVGDGVTTFNAPDLRGRLVATIDNLNGSAANRLTTSTNGCGTAMTTVGAVCANGNESQTLTVAQMPAHNHGVTDPGHVHAVNVQSVNAYGGGVGSGLQSGTPSVASTASAVTGVLIQNNGGGTAHPIVPPTIALSKILRIL